MKRMDYETLSMEEIVVEMEDGFLEGSIDFKQKGQNAPVTSGAQDYKEINGNAFDSESPNVDITWE